MPALFFCLFAAAAQAQAGAGQSSAAVPVLFVSDIHFEPFWDPAKAAQLASGSDWKSVLAAPDSPGRAEQFAKLQQACHAKGVDTSDPLWRSSLQAMRANTAGVKFIVVGGDLISHDFTCKFATLFPNATPAGALAFTVKTIAYVEEGLHAAFPGIPVYTTLGNNDSACGDYQNDAHGDFLAATALLLIADVPQPERTAALDTFTAGGYYAVSLPAPMRPAQLLVLNDNFMSDRYRTCSGKPDPSAAADEIAWLRKQLTRARQAGDNVWVMGHIPPGINPYSTIGKTRNVCGGDAPVLYQSSDALAGTLTDFGDEVRLAIFAHSHMDQLELLLPRAAAQPAVAVKIIPSISPVDGNAPSFIVGQVEAATAALKDYRVIEASNSSGNGTAWTEEYDFDQDFHQPEFSAFALRRLIAGFQADGEARTPASRDYLDHYLVRARVHTLRQFWPQYVCSLENGTPESYRACACATRH